MFYEDVTIVKGDLIWQLAVAYGYKTTEVGKVLGDPKNAPLLARRKEAKFIQAGDVVQIPIPWTVTTQTLTSTANGATLDLWRDGERGRRLTWVQTVDQGNQAVAGTAQQCVDGCPADDNLPFYWTDPETAADPDLRKHFSDTPGRNPPTAAQGTTQWRAVVSLALVTGQRVTVWDSLLWGFDLEPGGKVTLVGPRDATAAEVTQHLTMLTNGLGTGPATFGAAGWTFRQA
jgi:hypothetical protein